MGTKARIDPIPSMVVEFAQEFVSRMRARQDLKQKPSIRQTEAIPQFLSARYFKQGRLSLDDLVEAAVYTTFPADQKVARDVAEDIVLGREDEEKTLLETQQKKQKQKKAKKAVTDSLNEVINTILREQELSEKIETEKISDGYNYLRKLKNSDKDDLLNSATDYLTEGDIVLRGISNDERLKQEASQELLERIGGLSSRDIENSKTLDSLDQVCSSHNRAESLAAKALRGDSDVQKEFNDLAQRDPATGARALSHMKDIGSPKKATRDAMQKKLEDSIQNLEEMTSYASHLNELPKNSDSHVQSAPQEFAFDESMRMVNQIKNHTGKSLHDQLMKEYDSQFSKGASENVDHHQLGENATPQQNWKNLVKKVTDRTIERAQSRSAPAEYLLKKLAQHSKLSKDLPGQCKHTWNQQMQQLSDEAIKQSQSKAHMRKNVRRARRMGTGPSEQAIRQRGQELGMSESEILELVNPSFEVAKKLIKQGVKDFDRLHGLISSAGLSQSQLKELADMANRMGNASALGAIGHVDLQAALGMAGRRHRGGGEPDPQRADMALRGLLGGPATNIVTIWYTYRESLPPEFKRRLKQIAKRLLIDLGKSFARAVMGSSMLGGIQPSTTVRPFRIGDDIDLIDLEETLSHLLSEGRTDFRTLRPDDFLITETYHGHRAFYWALDKSGSMHHPKKLGMLSISVMAGLYGIQKDDFGVVLFDNTTHIVKDMADSAKSVEKVASNLLDLRASGGTGGASSIRLALQNFEKTRAREKVFIFCTDVYLSDQSECTELMAKIKKQGIDTIILVPAAEYDRKSADELAKSSHGVVLDIDSIDELPQRLLRLTNY
ncbi:MAG: VWA domain-containing protein [Candidatus Thorarchaeota archaeon]|nr:VWA domain-containing protein [Candidatus Thorarchaeota archaeon]